MQTGINHCLFMGRASVIDILAPCIIHLLLPGAAGIMNPKLAVWLLLLLAVGTVTVLAQRRRPTEARDAWNYRDGCEHPDYSLFTLGQRSSSGLMSK